MDPVSLLLAEMGAATRSQQLGATTLQTALSEAILRLDSEGGAGFTTGGLRLRTGSIQKLEQLETTLFGDGVTPGVLNG